MASDPAPLPFDNILNQTRHCVHRLTDRLEYRPVSLGDLLPIQIHHRYQADNGYPKVGVLDISVKSHRGHAIILIPYCFDI